jgi:hypothetical protein
MVVNSNWIRKSIIDTQFKNVIDAIGKFDISDGPWIAGGCARKLWQGTEWRNEDIDIFFKNNHQFEMFIDSTKPKKLNIQHFYDILFPDRNTPKCKYSISHNTDNAKTFSVEIEDKNITANKIYKVQAICRWFPESAEHLFNDFDWTVCQFISDGRHIWATQAAIEGINSNQIILAPTSKREIKATRLMKYLAYGFEADDEMILAMMKRLEDNPDRSDELTDDY